MAKKNLILAVFLLNFLASAQPSMKIAQFLSAGIKIFPSSNDVRFYVETSVWTPYFLGADTGIEIGVKNIELYGEAQTGVGLLGYSHGLYYRFPYSSSNYYGWRGKLWAGFGYYASIDFDYTQNEKGLGMFASFPMVFAFTDVNDFCREQGFYCE